jgi:hypothetical protein
MADEPNDDLDVEALQAQLASLSVGQFLVSAASTIASLAYAKLERNDLDEARKAIDALAALTPHLEGELADDLALALTRLQIAYSKAVNP